MKPAFYSFRFSPEGFNSVTASTMPEARREAKALAGRFAFQIDPKSFKRLGSKELVDAYYANIPLMD